MLIVSLKLKKNVILATVASLCLVMTLVFLFAPGFESDVLKNDMNNAAKTDNDRVLYLEQLGYSVQKEPIQIEEVIIPPEFDALYTKYNTMQAISGHNLEKWKGKKVKKYTYKITNYKDKGDEVVANLLIDNDKIIGGDISSTNIDGFTHGLMKSQ